MAVNRIKVFGERNTGTNFVEDLLKRNLDCAIVSGNLSRRYAWWFPIAYRVLPESKAFAIVEGARDRIFERRFAKDGGWKHARVPNFPSGITAYPNGMGMIALTKNPYAWLLSLHKRPYQGQEHSRFGRLGLSEFLRRPWQTVGREFGPVRYETPIEMWNDKVESYFALGQYAPTIIRQYEHVIADIPNFFNDLSDSFSLTAPKSFTIPTGSTKKDGRTTEQIIAYYQTKQWRSSFSDEDMAFINARLDQRLMQKIAYEILD